MPLKILWFNWKDIRHPEAGGAEIVTHEMAKKLVGEGHQVTLITAKYKNSSRTDEIDGINIIRVGNSKLGHYPAAIYYYLKHFKNQFDIIIEEVNTIPYFINFFKGSEKVFLYYNQLAREVWFHQMVQPLSTIGYFIAEPIYTWIQSRFNNTVLSISESSKADLVRFGFKPENIKIMTMFISTKPLISYIPDHKEKDFTVLFHSSLRPMKRPVEVFKSFKILFEKYPKSQLWISGGGDQKELKNFARTNGFEDRVTFFGRTSEDKKRDLMQKATVLCSTSLKEGWGLIVTEANSMGTPAIVYDIDGLRDASKAGNNWTVSPDPNSLAQKLNEVSELFYKNRDKYDQKCEEVLDKSRKYTLEKCYDDLKQILNIS